MATVNQGLHRTAATWHHCQSTATSRRLDTYEIEDSRKLLIVEDDPGLLKQLKWCFEDYDVFTAEDRESAIAELRRHEPVVVLQDLGLPPNPEGVEEGLRRLRES